MRGATPRLGAKMDSNVLLTTAFDMQKKNEVATPRPGANMDLQCLLITAFVMQYYEKL